MLPLPYWTSIISRAFDLVVSEKRKPLLILLREPDNRVERHCRHRPPEVA
jgi:hypothetical protein